MTDYWLIRAGENGELWNAWSNADILTIGWDIGRIGETKPDKDQIETQIDDKYDPKESASRPARRIRTFIGLHDSPSKNLKEGDIVVVEGDASVAGIAVVGEYRYERGVSLEHHPIRTGVMSGISTRVP